MEKAYETYKDSGVEWIGEIPKSWKSVSLKYIANTFGRIGYRGYTVNDIVDEGKGAISLSPSNINGQRLVFDKKTFISWEKYDESPEIQIFEGDVVLVKTASVGKATIIDNLNGYKATINPQLVVFKEIKIDSKYFYYTLISDVIQKRIESETNGGVVGTLTQQSINTYNFPKPSPQEQTQIAAYLDYHTQLIDTLISKKETLIQKLQEQRQAIINEAVTKGLNKNVVLKDSGIEWLGEIPEHWEVVKFRYKFETSKGLTITKANLQDEGVPCVNYGEIHSKYGFEVNPEIHNLKCVSEEYLNTNESSLLSKGDFVFADTSEDIEGSGNFTHLHSDIPTFAGYHTIIARLVDNSNYRFFAYFFDSSTFRTQIQNLVKGVKVFSITNKILKDTDLLFPPIEEQNQIADFIDVKIDKIFVSSEKLKTSIQKLKEYRQSLISEAVTGKIDVRDWRPKKHSVK